jgi:hypothetical protein
MSMVKRQAEAFEEMRHDLIQIALKTGAIKLDDDDGETLLTQCNADAERHAYARATNLCKRHRWDTDLPEMREVMRDILDGARFGNRD